MSNIFVFKDSDSSGSKSKWQFSAFGFVLLLSLLNTLIYHWPLLGFAYNNLNVSSLNGLQTIFTLLLIPFVCTFIFLSVCMMLNRHVTKFIFSILILLNAIFLFYIETNNVILDKSVLIHAFNIDLKSAQDLMSQKLLIYILCYGLLPIALLIKLKSEVVDRFWFSMQSGALVIVVLLWIVFSFKTLLWMDKHEKQLKGMVLPWSYLVIGGKLQLSHVLPEKEIKILPSAVFTKQEKTVLVLVIGESARAKNFELYGYQRDTNPQLKQKGALALTAIDVCDTSTQESLKCMLANTNGYQYYEPLPNYLINNGVQVWWRSNNVIDHEIKASDFKYASMLQENCNREACFTDEVLMRSVIADIQSSDEDQILIVLHQSGSEGPEYYNQYPDFFEKYTPVCQSLDLNTCTEQSLINAYDNSIYYTDFVLGSIISELQTLNGYATAMIYTSDHGESLGEAGMYLHGLPKWIAPDEQRTVPFVLWMSDQFKQSHQISDDTMTSRNNHTSQNVFHSVMGAFHLNSEIYRPDLDVFKAVE